MNKETYKKYYQSGEGHFWMKNPNPRAEGRKGFRWDTADCCIRALANSIGCSWLEAFDWLTVKARRDYSVVNDMIGFRKWLQEGGAKWEVCKAVKGKKRLTVKEFAEAHPTGRYIVTIANHETAVVDGTILDVWNCGENAVVGYYDMAEFKL